MPRARNANLKNATITMPRSVYVAARKAAAEQDKSLSAWVSELVAQKVRAPPDDGLTPGQRLVRNAMKRGAGLGNKEPLEVDPTKLMGNPKR